MKLRIAPFILSATIVAAHFLRSYDLLPMLLCLAAPALLLIKKQWVLIVLQFLCLIAVVIWMFTLYGIIQERILEGRSWVASAMILGAVAAFTLFSGWLLNSKEVKSRYPA